VIALGVDPDLRNSGFAVVQSRAGAKPLVEFAFTIRTDAKEAREWDLVDAAVNIRPWNFPTGPIERATVEAQMIYPRQKARPNDILRLAYVAGSWAGKLAAVLSCSVETVLPRDWRGTIPKAVAQARILSRVEWPLREQVAATLTKTEFSDVVDAIGLALYGLRLPGAITPTFT
jgi:hypothetical protein